MNSLKISHEFDSEVGTFLLTKNSIVERKKKKEESNIEFSVFGR